MKSKILLKAILVVSGIISIYTVLLYFVIVPRISNNFQELEEKNAKTVLNKIVTISKNVYKDLEIYKKESLYRYKMGLKNLTDVALSVVKAKYEQSNPEHIGTLLKTRGDEFKKSLISFYNKNRDKMSQEELKRAIIDYVNIHRHDNGIGYFWINDFKPNMILHPIVSKLNGKFIGDYQDPNGVYLFKEMVNICKKDGSGFVKYQWLNPKSEKIEDKISYVFTFEPFSWIIGTGEYYSVLKKKLQDEVSSLVKQLKYGENGYFFIADYNNKIISHPTIKANTDLSNTKDANGILIIPEIIKNSRNGSGFTKYLWSKKSGTKPVAKLSFSKDFPKWEMVIGTGIYIDDIDDEIAKRKQELMNQLRKIILTTKIAKTGYLYIFNSKGKVLIHPNDNLNNKYLTNLINPTTGHPLINDLINGCKKNKKIVYKWDKPTDKWNYIYDKISWVEYIPELDWYIGSSVYINEIKESADTISNFILLISIIILIVTTIFSILFFRNLLIPITQLSKLALKVTHGNYDVRCEIKRNDEIGILSNEFNKMVKTIEDSIINLDNKVKERTLELEKSNKNIRDSIQFASLIQQALLPDLKILDKYIKDSFVFWQPRDTVGGDIFVITELDSEKEFLVMVIDGAGHGVPGAFVTMLVKAIEQQIIGNIQAGVFQPHPAKILSYFNVAIKTMLKQEKGSKSNAGFDGGILYYNKETNICKYAGAKTPLYIVNNGELKVIKSDRKNVGFIRTKIDQEYTEYNIEIKKGTQLYLSTDGIIDQEGINNNRFGKANFEDLILKNSYETLINQKNLLTKEFKKFKSNKEQSDDITIIGLKI